MPFVLIEVLVKMPFKKRFTYLDGLKGIAILLVTMGHSGGAELSDFWRDVAKNSWAAVQMFFVISAMLAYSSLDHFF